MPGENQRRRRAFATRIDEYRVPDSIGGIEAGRRKLKITASGVTDGVKLNGMKNGRRKKKKKNDGQE